MGDDNKIGNGGYERWKAEVEARAPINARIAEDVAANKAWRKEVKAARAGHPKSPSQRMFDGPTTEEKPFRSRLAEKVAQREFDEGFPRDW